MKKVLLPLVMIPAIIASSAVFACQDHTSDQKTLEQSNVIDLQNQGEDAVLYNFHSHKCDSLADAHNDADISAHLPSDEDWQGLYSRYRFKGEMPVDALAHVYNTMLDAQINFTVATSSKKSLFARSSVIARQNSAGG